MSSSLPLSSPISHSPPVVRQIPQTGEPTTLTWNPPEGDTSFRSPVNPTFENDIPLILPPRSPSPEERPPGYASAQRLTRDTLYSFTPTGNNALVLVPPSDAQDTRPRYYITVRVNVFMPLSHITTIYRGSTEYGEVVGEFEMGIMNSSSRLQFGDKVVKIASTITKIGSRNKGYWLFSIPTLPRKTTLKWSYESRPCICRLAINFPTILARFKPSLGSGLRGSIPELEVTPAGQELFDHIVLSLLVIERKRLTPGMYAVFKQIFN